MPSHGQRVPLAEIVSLAAIVAIGREGQQPHVFTICTRAETVSDGPLGEPSVNRTACGFPSSGKPPGGVIAAPGRQQGMHSSGRADRRIT